jgi:hypothetical protein
VLIEDAYRKSIAAETLLHAGRSGTAADGSGHRRDCTVARDPLWLTGFHVGLGVEARPASRTPQGFDELELVVWGPTFTEVSMKYGMPRARRRHRGEEMPRHGMVIAVLRPMQRCVIFVLGSLTPLWLCACGSSGAAGSSADTDGSAFTGIDAGADVRVGVEAAVSDSSSHPDGASDGAVQGDAGEGGQNGEAGTGNCTPTTCPSSDICIQSQVSGGAIIQENDAGVCPAGMEPEPGSAGRCMRDPTTRCATRPSSCGSAVTCACAEALCPTSFTCEDSADASFLACEEFVP